MTKHTAKRVDGGYEYRGYHIYKTSQRSGAYNPWKISLGRSFASLAEVKKYIDAKLEK